MELNYAYPVYQADLSREKLLECVDIAARLLEDVGIQVRHERFRQALEGKDGVKIEGNRIKLKRTLVQKNIEKILEKTKGNLLRRQETPGRDNEWKLLVGGTSMAVIDIETDEVRPATCVDLRDLIRLMDSYGVEGNYPVMPQDLPAIMRAVACYKICWESSGKVKPGDFQNIRQTDYIYEMHKVMGKVLTLYLTVTQTMCLSEHDLEIFFKFYPEWKKGADIRFSVLDYPMLGITKPVTATGCITQYLA